MTIHLHRDSWGIPHLRAGDARELAYAQGLNAARDRAWQIEVEHRRLRGTSAAVLGADSLAWDVLARRARLAHTARLCWLALDDATRDWLAAYTAGVNAALPQAAREAPEFAATDSAPGHWQPWVPLGIWLSTHLLFTGMPAKLWRAETEHRLGPGASGLFTVGGIGTAGSNGWLLTGERTASGAPLLAGDPHRYVEDPGGYQQIRLACPEFDVVGLAVPGVPGIPHFGHTGTVAWGITHAMADYQDLYRERLRRTAEGGVEALGPDGWRPAEHGTETVTVAGGEPVTVEVMETARGPVLVGGPDDREAISLRHVPRVARDMGFAALPRLLRARTVADVDRACDAWVEPVNVLLAADTEGGTLHRVAGRVPVRHPANRLRPVPAWEAAHAWEPDAYEPLPRAEVTGLAVMANEAGLAAPLGVEFMPGHQHRRIGTLLNGATGWTAEAMEAVHADTLAGETGTLLGPLAALDGLSADASLLRKRLLAWDGRMDADSTDAAAYAAVRAACARLLVRRPEFAALRGMAGEGLTGGDGTDGRPSAAYPEALWPWLALGPRVAFALPNLLTPGAVPGLDPGGLIRAAVEEVAAAGAGGTTWGARHRLAAWRALPGAEGPDAGPLAGDHDCVLATASVPGVTDLSARGPVARYVWDLGNREESRWIVPFGAHGRADHPHHHDQTPLWREGRLARVVTDWAALAHEELPPADTAGDGGRAAVFTRTVAGFGTLSLTPVDPAADLPLLHSWVTQERARFWGMTDLGREEVLEIYEFLDSLDTHHAYVVRRDGTPVALFQTYDPAADEVGTYYDVRPGDIGVHLLIAPPPGPLRRGFTSTLMPTLLAFVLADPAVHRIVAEPDLRNDKAIERALRTGLELGPLIDLPHKRAQLAFLSREAAVRQANGPTDEIA
ncbi:GNAT family N-acetyltransferase [Streptomyces avicenniae]|uniref:GNAT family N-acetyltransferase n=1 Tax=Streptomyces avicenniae TaxID=500153 RepID=UPI00069A8DDA|nr:GNAT family N-acetyltransferase [Streptomyces avicenniae]